MAKLISLIVIFICTYIKKCQFMIKGRLKFITKHLTPLLLLARCKHLALSGNESTLNPLFSIQSLTTTKSNLSFCYRSQFRSYCLLLLFIDGSSESSLLYNTFWTLWKAWNNYVGLVLILCRNRTAEEDCRALNFQPEMNSWSLYVE